MRTELSTRTWTVVAIPTLCESEYLRKLLDDLIQEDYFDQLIVLDDRQEDNGNSDISFLQTPGIKVVSRPAWRSFYGMWNYAWGLAKHGGQYQRCPSNLVLLNDDIEIPDRFVERMVDALRSDDEVWCVYPDYRVRLDHDDLAVPIPWDDDNADPMSDMRRASRTAPPGFMTAPKLTPTKGTYREAGLWGCAFALRGEVFENPLPPIDERFKIWCGDDDLVKQIDLAGKKTCRVEGLALEHHSSTTFRQHPELHAAGWDDLERFQRKYA